MPFNHAYVDPTYRRHLCCISEPIEDTHAVPLSDFWNSDAMKQIRLNMIHGEPVDICKICYEKEKTGIPSYRETALEHELSWSNSHEWLTDEVIETGVAEHPTHFDYRTIHCNLTCNHCNSGFSSEHMRLRKKYVEDDAFDVASNKEKLSFTIDKEFEESMLKDLIDAVDNRKLQRIYFAGGEPMMSPFHWEFIERVKEIYDDEDPEYIKTINFYYNTNLTRSNWKKNNVYEYLKFLNPTIHASIDGVGKTFEYVRNGANWENVKLNFMSAYKNLSNEDPNKSFGVQPVILSHNIFNMDEMLSFFERFENLKIQPMILLKASPVPLEGLYNCHPGFLDPCEFPSEIMLPAIERAKERVNNSTVKGVKDILPILDEYEVQIKKDRWLYKKHVDWSFARTKEMEKHSNISLNSLLKDSNIEAWLWYNKLCYTYKDIDITKYKFLD